MKKKQFIRISITILLLFLFLFLVSFWKERQTPPALSFKQEYAVEGEPLTVIAAHYPYGTSLSYTWEVDGTIVDNHTDTYIPTHDDLGKFIKVTVSPDNASPELQLQMYFSRLPVFYINTTDGGPIYSKDYYFDAAITMQGNECYNASNMEVYNGPMQIKGRGNSTWHAAKLPYKMKLPTSTDLFHMGSNKHWVLLANAFDDSLMRNKIAYDLSGAMGMPYMESTWVDVILNGEYLGNYQFCEQIRIDKNRVNITNLEDYAALAAKTLVKANVVSPDHKKELEDYLTWHMEWLTTGIVEYEGHTFDLSPYLALPEIKGGFLFELDAFYDEPSRFMIDNQPLMFHNPKFIGTNDDVMGYAIEFVSAFYDAAYHSEDFYTTYQGAPTHYSQLFDMESLAKFFLITEIFFNEDTGLKSTYFYKDLNDLAHMGPVWDMDYSSGGQGHQSYIYDQWQAVFYSNYSQANQWYKGLIRDPYFLSIALENWMTYRDVILNLPDKDGPIENAYQYIHDSAQANEILWPPEPPVTENGPVTYGFGEGYQTFKNWMTNRLSWLDHQFTSLDALVASIGAYDAGTGVNLSITGHTATVCAEYGSYAVFYYNGIRQTELSLEDGSVSWQIPDNLYNRESDVLQVRIYNNDDIQIGTDYHDFRE